jgi:hypothetical protein
MNRILYHVVFTDGDSVDLFCVGFTGHDGAVATALRLLVDSGKSDVGVRCVYCPFDDSVFRPPNPVFLGARIESLSGEVW